MVIASAQPPPVDLPLTKRCAQAAGAGPATAGGRCRQDLKDRGRRPNIAGPPMRLVMTRRLEPGAVLAADVLTGRSGTPLLRKGTTLTGSYRDSLVRAGINAVYVDDELSRGIVVPQILSDRTREEATSALAQAFRAAPSVFGGE